MSDIHEQIKAQYEAYLNEAQSFDEKVLRPRRQELERLWAKWVN